MPNEVLQILVTPTERNRAHGSGFVAEAAEVAAAK